MGLIASYCTEEKTYYSRNNLFWHYQNICNICVLEPQVYEEVQYRLRICVYNYIILLYKMIDTLKVLLIKSCGGLFIISRISSYKTRGYYFLCSLQMRVLLENTKFLLHKVIIIAGVIRGAGII